MTILRWSLFILLTLLAVPVQMVLYNFFDQFVRDGLVKAEPDGSFAMDIGSEFFVKCRIAHENRVERDMILPPGEIDEVAAVELERGNLVADGFLGVGSGFQDGLPDLFQDPLHRLGKSGDIFVDGEEGFFGGGHGVIIADHIEMGIIFSPLIVVPVSYLRRQESMIIR